MTLTEFLLARIAEDEAVAIATRDSHDPLVWTPADYRAPNAWGLAGPLDGPSGYDSLVVDPGRVLTECEAKRRIVERSSYADDTAPGYKAWAFEPGDGIATDNLHDLALPYADHPDYDEGWRP